MKRVFYLYRDGRDVAVSGYFHYVRNSLYGESAAKKNIHMKKIGKIFDKTEEEEMFRTEKYMARFLEQWVKDDFNPSFGRNWAAHVTEWFESGAENIAFLSYEGLLERAVEILSSALQKHADIQVEKDAIEKVVELNSFQRISGRSVGKEDPTSFIRKGIAGDWKNHFDQESCRIFDHYCGEALIKLGYEKDHNWY